jgi:anti-sigma28 factor (negative regulator of flagellin synthesis)
MDVLTQLARAAAGGRARGARPPDPERLRRLARAVGRGEYEVPAERVAEALIRAIRDPWATRD